MSISFPRRIWRKRAGRCPGVLGKKGEIIKRELSTSATRVQRLGRYIMGVLVCVPGAVTAHRWSGSADGRSPIHFLR